MYDLLFQTLSIPILFFVLLNCKTIHPTITHVVLWLTPHEATHVQQRDVVGLQCAATVLLLCRIC